jgi:phage terminase Nu1 subunit (DNA packaging protein)
VKEKSKPKSEPKRKPLDIHLNKRQMCASLGISTTAFDRYCIKPDLVVGRVNYYLARQVVDNRIEAERKRLCRKRPAAPKELGDLNPIAEKARLDKERADMQALKNAILLGKYLPMEAATFIFSKIGGDISSVLETIPAKIKRCLPTLPAREIDLIRLEVARAQNMAAAVDNALDEYIEEFNAGVITEI